MSVLMVPALDAEPWPTLGPQVVAFIESYLVFGPGDLRGEPARVDAEKRALIYRFYELFPQGHEQAGRRRFKRCAVSLRKGSAKTELLAWIAACELHPDGPVRCDGWDAAGQPVGVGVIDPYIPMVAFTEQQSDELAYGALRVILQYSQVAQDFDIGIERIMRVGGDGKAVSLASAPDARDGARTTFNVFDEALALDTPLPTPTGWTTMGAVQPGDMLFGRDGAPCRVVGKSPVQTGRPCYRVSFKDGTSVVTDEGHLWLAHRRGGSGCGRGRRGPGQGWGVRRTADMLNVVYPNGGQRAYAFHVPRPGPLELPEAELPIDPYVLGLWLGDGDARNATISVGADDLEQTEALLAKTGCTASRCETRGNTPLLYVSDGERVYGGTIRARLGGLDLYKNKHIPAMYLRASTAQRLALLQGLMDADGHATPRGWCTLVTNSGDMAAQAAELMRTLGYSPTVRSRVDERSRTGEMIKVSFQSRADMVPFRLPRKAARCGLAPLRQARYAWRPIVGVEPVPSVETQCLAVDTDDHLFLAGEGMVPTHNTHRFTLPRLKQAHRTMLANIPKRRLSDAWSLETTTAPAPGEGSVAEDTMDYARQVTGGKINDSRLFFFHRQASDGHDLDTPEGIRAAVIEASGPVAEWSDIDGICEQWRDPTADRAYLERVWLNRLVRASERAFDAEKWRALADLEHVVPDGAKITLGFDGARYHDATALVGTEIATGFQWLIGCWERPQGIETWEVPVDEVEAAIDAAFRRWDVWRLYADPPYWETHVAQWAGQYGEKRAISWWTTRTKPMAYAIRGFVSAIASGELHHDGSAALARHVGNACRRVLSMRDDQGVQLWTIYKERPDSPHKIDAAMAAILSWEARRDALTAGVNAETESVYATRGILLI